MGRGQSSSVSLRAPFSRIQVLCLGAAWTCRRMPLDTTATMTRRLLIGLIFLLLCVAPMCFIYSTPLPRLKLVSASVAARCAHGSALSATRCKLPCFPLKTVKGLLRTGGLTLTGVTLRSPPLMCLQRKRLKVQRFRMTIRRGHRYRPWSQFIVPSGFMPKLLSEQ